METAFHEISAKAGDTPHVSAKRLWGKQKRTRRIWKEPGRYGVLWQQRQNRLRWLDVMHMLECALSGKGKQAKQGSS